MGDQLQNQGDRSFQSINPNSYPTNMNPMFPPQMMNLDNSMMSATGGPNQATSQMFEMFNQMMMKMMINQNGNQMNPNMFQSMMNQANNNLGGMGMNNNNNANQQMGINGFGGGNNIPSQYLSQQQQKQSSNNNLNYANNANMDNAFRNIQDRFSHEQSDIQSFYDKLQNKNQSPISVTSNNPVLFNKKPNQQMMGNNLLDISSTLEPQLPNKSEYIDCDSFDQSQNYSNPLHQNKQSFSSNQNIRGIPHLKDDDNNYFNKNQAGPYQKSGGSSISNFVSDDMKPINNNVNNDRMKVYNNQRSNQQMNQFSDQKQNNNPSSVSEDNEFLRESVLNMHQNQQQNMYDNRLNNRNQLNKNKNNAFNNSNNIDLNEEYGFNKPSNLNNIKKQNYNSLTDNEQQYLTSHLKDRNPTLNDDRFDRPNKGQNENIYPPPPIPNKNQQNRQFENFEDDSINQYLPNQNKNSRQNFSADDDERPIKGAHNQRNPYESEQSYPTINQKPNNNKNSQFLNKNIYDDERSHQYQKNNNNMHNDEVPILPQKNNNIYKDERPIQSKNNNYLDEERSIQPQKNNGDESDRSYNLNSQRKNPIDDIPIKSNGGFKRFEDLIEEKIRQEGDDEYNDNYNSGNVNRRKTFLKKGSRTFLSNAQQRSKAAQSHIEEIVSQKNESDPKSITASILNAQKPKKSVSSTFKSATSLTKAETFNSNQNNFNEKPVGGNNKLNQIHSMGGLEAPNQASSSAADLNDKNNNTKEKKKFLQRGKGKGGGVQGYKKEEGSQSQTQIPKDTNEKTPQNNQQKKNEKKPPQQQQQQQQKHKKNSDLISLDDEDEYIPINKKNVRNSDDEFDNDDFNDHDKDFGGKKYQPFKYMQDNQEEDNYFDQKNKNSRPPTSGIQNKNIKKDSEDNKNKLNNKNEGGLQFDDEEEWGDDSYSNKNKQANKTKFNKKEEEKKPNKLNIHDSDVGSDQDDENEFKDDKSNNDDDNDDPDQQYSKVVQKYFNKKGNNSKTTGGSTPGGNSQRAPGSISLHDLTAEQKRQIIQEFTNDQIEQLNSEISKVKLENERVKRMRSKYEDLLKAFNKEKEQFTKQKELEIQELEEWKKEEKKKVQNEKRIADRQQKAMQNMPNRKEREEIENLKALNKKLQEEIKIKDQRNKLTIDRQKKLIDEITQKNSELKDEIKHLENMRLDGGSSTTNKQANLSRTSSTKQPAQKNPSKSPFKTKPQKNLGEESYYNEDEEEDQGGYSQNHQKNRQKKISMGGAGTGDVQKKRNHTYSNNYDYQYDNSTAKYHDDDENPKFAAYDQDGHYDDQDDEDDQFENYENYHKDPSTSKGSKQGFSKNRHDSSQEHEHSYSGQQDDEVDDENLETYEDIINFNPTNHTYNDNKKGNKNDIKSNPNLKSQHSADIPSSTTNKNSRLSAKSNSISISNNNQNGNNINHPISTLSTLSSANKNDKKKQIINEKSEKENKQSVTASVQPKQLQQQQQQQKQKQNNNSSNANKQKSSFVYDITTLSTSKNFSIRMIGEEIDRSQFHYDSNIFYENFLASSANPSRPISENITQDGKIQTTYEDGKQQVVFANGVKRQIYPNGYTLVNFINDDVKQVLPDQTVIYYFADAQTTQTTLQTNINIYNFPNSQIEVHYPSGRKEIKFADGTEKYIYEDGEEKTFFADGTVQTVDINKVKKIRYKNGKEDVIYPDQGSDTQH